MSSSGPERGGSKGHNLTSAEKMARQEEVQRREGCRATPGTNQRDSAWRGVGRRSQDEEGDSLGRSSRGLIKNPDVIVQAGNGPMKVFSDGHSESNEISQKGLH